MTTSDGPSSTGPESSSTGLLGAAGKNSKQLHKKYVREYVRSSKENFGVDAATGRRVYHAFANDWFGGLGGKKKSALVVIELDMALWRLEVTSAIEVPHSGVFGDNDRLPAGHQLGCDHGWDCATAFP